MKKWLLLLINIACINAIDQARRVNAIDQAQPVNAKRTYKAGKHTYQGFNPQLPAIKEEEEINLDESGYESDVDTPTQNTPTNLRSIATIAKESPGFVTAFRTDYVYPHEKYNLESLEGLHELLNTKYTIEIMHNLTVPPYTFMHLQGLQHIPKNSFDHEKTKKLTTLKLTNGKLKTLPKNLLKPLTELKLLDLSNNGLEYLPAGFFSHLPNLQHVNLKNNNFSQEEIDRIVTELMRINSDITIEATKSK